MKDLQSIYMEVKTELKRINMDYSPRIAGIKVNGRLKACAGQCTLNLLSGVYFIEIARFMVQDAVETQSLKNVIAHEIIHTCPDCMNHDAEFTKRAGRLNRMLGYNVKISDTEEEMSKHGVEVPHESYKYAFVCKKCGAKIPRKRWSKTMENVKQFRHGGCGGNLFVVSLETGREVEAASPAR